MLGSECEEAAVGGGPCVDSRAERKPARRGAPFPSGPSAPELPCPPGPACLPQSLVQCGLGH